jgi:hypothetical protein
LLAGAASAPVEVWSPWRATPPQLGYYVLANALYARIQAHEIWGLLRGWLARETPSVDLDALPSNTQRLYACAILTILGEDLESPGDRLICWTPDGQMVGTIRIAWMVACYAGVDVHNLAKPSTLDQWQTFLDHHAPLPLVS